MSSSWLKAGGRLANVLNFTLAAIDVLVNSGAVFPVDTRHAPDVEFQPSRPLPIPTRGQTRLRQFPTVQSSALGGALASVVTLDGSTEDPCRLKGEPPQHPQAR